MTMPATKPLAVVTGASSGIGLELAKQFAQNGFDLVVAAEDVGLSDAALELKQLGAEVNAVQVDLAEYDGVERLYAEVRASGRPVNAVALNAGIGVSGDFSRDTSLDDELKLLQLNVIATVHLAKRLARDMVQRGEGRMLFTSSIASTMPGPYYSVYAASKSFIQSFAEALAEELDDSAVTVTSLMPGPTATNFFRRAGMEDTAAGTGPKDEPAKVAQQGFEAMLAGKRKVVGGGIKTRVQEKVAGVLPDAVKAKLHGRMAAPGSGKK